ncbi:MAG: hypothetical protein ACK5NK_05075, partial [Niabella sp.]
NRRQQDEPFRVKTVDGVFLGMKKTVWSVLKFDESIKGFHFYDIDISLRASKIYKNYLINNIDILHFSTGNYGNDWLKACINFNKRNYDNFDKATKQELNQIRDFHYTRFEKENISFLNRIRYIMNLGFSKKTVKRAIWFLIARK